MNEQEQHVPTQRHDLDLFSLLAGLGFAAIGGLFLASGAFDVDVNPRWVVGAVLVGLGLAGVLAATLRRPRVRAEPAEPAAEPTEPAAELTKP